MLPSVCDTVNMSKERRVPPKQKMEAYLRRGMTQRAIAEAWEEESGIRVSRSAIGMAIERYGLQSARPRPRYADLLPWHVSQEHIMHYDARMLRAEGRRREGLPLSDDVKSRLTAWLNELHNKGAVVAYDPLTDNGFYWLAREPQHDDIIDRPTS